MVTTSAHVLLVRSCLRRVFPTHWKVVNMVNGMISQIYESIGFLHRPSSCLPEKPSWTR
uniref:Uncharacterized protein n=1 Tax=Tetranychus urticae TaxID=32264 RepID=T1KHY5_TETUR